MEQFRQFKKWLREQGNSEMETWKFEKRGVLLDEKYFRRVDRFDGDVDKYRVHWLRWMGTCRRWWRILSWGEKIL